MTTTIIEAILAHPLQVMLMGVMLFHAVCEGLAALPLHPRRKARAASVCEAA